VGEDDNKGEVVLYQTGVIFFFKKSDVVRCINGFSANFKKSLWWRPVGENILIGSHYRCCKNANHHCSSLALTVAKTQTTAVHPSH